MSKIAMLDMFKTVFIVNMFAVRMSVKAFELVPAIERVNLLSEKASTQVCFLCTNLIKYFMKLHKLEMKKNY